MQVVLEDSNCGCRRRLWNFLGLPGFDAGSRHVRYTTAVVGESAPAPEEAEAADSTMTDSDNMRVEEKLRQFENDMATDNSQTMEERSVSEQTLQDQMDKQRRRNLIFDEERFEETFLKCLICRENYNDKEKLPKMLPCHHTFCLDCLCQMFRVEGEFRQSLTTAFRGMPMSVKIQCPSCRDGLITSEAELRRLPNDHTITELLTFVKDTGRSDIQYCSKHQLQPLHFFCEPCIQPVCRDCTVIDHKELKGHVVVNVEEALQKYTPILDDTMSDIKGQKVQLSEQREALEQAAHTVDHIQHDLHNHIRSVFDTIRAAVDEREREMYDISNSEINNRRVMIEGHLKTLSERESTLNSQFNGLQQAKDDKDISQMFTGHKEACEVLRQEVNVPTDCVKDFNVTFQYNARHDSSIRQQVSSLGNILFQS